MAARILADQRVRFAFVGGWNTLFGYLAFLAVHFAAGESLGPYWTLVLAYAIALPQAFLSQRLIVFNATGNWIGQFLKFAFANSGVFIANLVLLSALLTVTHWNPVIIQGLLTILLAVASYLIHKHFSFVSS